MGPTLCKVEKYNIYVVIQIADNLFFNSDGRKHSASAS